MRVFKVPDGTGTVVRVDDSVADDLVDAGWEEVTEAPEPEKVMTTISTTTVSSGTTATTFTAPVEPKKK